jgi:hypothetical protein
MYGERRTDLETRGGRPRRWSTGTFELNGKKVANKDKRPSHADKRRGWGRELLRVEIRAGLHVGATEGEFQSVAERLLDLSA